MAARPLSTQAGGSEPQFSDFISVLRQFTIECRLRSISASCRCHGGGYVQGRTASWDSSGGKNINPPGLRSGTSSGFRSNARVRKFHAANHGVNTRVVLPRGFSGAAEAQRERIGVESEREYAHLLIDG